jgi:hypothetical protein
MAGIGVTPDGLHNGSAALIYIELAAKPKGQNVPVSISAELFKLTV